jgi:hypothetical protein
MVRAVHNDGIDKVEDPDDYPANGDRQKDLSAGG